MTFTLDEVLDALSEAFAQTHPRWSRDCEVEAKFKAILSARHHAKERVGIEPKQPVRGSGSATNHNPSSGQ